MMQRTSRSSMSATPTPTATATTTTTAASTSPTATAAPDASSDSLVHNIDLSYLDPSRVDWAKLNPLPPLHTLTAAEVGWMIFGGVVALIVIVWVIVLLVRMFRKSLVDYPVLLATPIRGSDFTPLASTLREPVYPVIDRVVLNNQGIALPYAGNELAFLPEPRPLPLLNNQVQFTLNFWMRIENFDYQTSGVNPVTPVVPTDTSTTGGGADTVSSGLSRYATLFAMNTGSSRAGGQFSVKYNSAANELVVTVMVIPPTAANTMTEAPQVFRIPSMLLLQKWQMVTVVLDNRHVDVYHNSNLQRSFVLPNVPYFNNSSGSLWKRPEWFLYPGDAPFGGMVSCARYFNYAFDVHESYRLYAWDKPAHTGEAPESSYFWWWTWTEGNSFTALYRTIVKDWFIGWEYMTFDIL